jgi:hypothetical protein
MLNMETVEFEGGMWHVFPPINAPVRFILLRVLPPSVAPDRLALCVLRG